MDIQEIQEILKDVSFAPSNLSMGWEWDIKTTKIYDDNGIVSEKGFSIRTTFMRPDVNSGEIEKGYGRWMYVPENISKDGLVKTAWVCAELIVKHELMEAFLYDKKRIFDPHKSIKDLQYNAREVDTSKIPLPEVDPSKVIKPQEEKKESSDEVFHKQNIGTHTSEITEYLEENLEGKKINAEREGQKMYKLYLSTVIHYEGRGVIVSDQNGKVVESISEKEYTLSNLKKILEKYKEDPKDPGLINSIISKFGYTDVSKKEVEDDNLGEIFVYKNPKNESKYVLHSENKFLSLVNKKKDILGTAEGDNYNAEYVEKVLNGSK